MSGDIQGAGGDEYGAGVGEKFNGEGVTVAAAFPQRKKLHHPGISGTVLASAPIGTATPHH